MRSRLILLLFAGLVILPAARAQSGAAEQGPEVAGFEQMQAARTALDEIVRAYESGDVGAMRARLDPAMIGYQRFLDGMYRDTANQKQIRLHFYEANVTAGPDVTMIQTRWEKRFFGVADFTPGVFSGRSTFLMHRAKDGWRLAAVSGDNPFSSESGALATLTVTPTTFTFPLRVYCPIGTAAIAIDLVDSDLAGLPSVTIEALTSQGDREGIVVPAVSPGHFRRASLPLCQTFDGPAPVNGTLEVTAGALPARLTLRYTDANPGTSRLPTTMLRTVTLQE
ncbi:MAG: hypothetical protein IT480_02555 [Gammaproteobacteria bacterium]|nr:hypothetical protein [Gammaproteobacteria bacterium]